MKVVLFLFAAILIMLCAALVCPVEINARARVKPRFGEGSAHISPQKDKAQTAKAGRQYITVDKKGNYYKAPVYNG